MRIYEWDLDNLRRILQMSVPFCRFPINTNSHQNLNLVSYSNSLPSPSYCSYLKLCNYSVQGFEQNLCFCLCVEWIKLVHDWSRILWFSVSSKSDRNHCLCCLEEMMARFNEVAMGRLRQGTKLAPVLNGVSMGTWKGRVFLLMGGFSRSRLG